MKKEVNKILLIILKDKKRLGYVLSSESSPAKQFNDIITSEGLQEEDIKSNYYFAKTRYTIDHFINHFDEEVGAINEQGIAIDFKIEEFRKQRSAFFSVLDLQFMKSMEEDCVECKEHVVSIKNYLRNLPFKLTEKLISLTTEDIVQFNAFNNVMRINIIHGGSGYTSPPDINIRPSDIPERGFPLEAIATVKDGSVNEIIVTQVGSGYSTNPIISISPPEDPDGERAIAVGTQVENNIYQK